jgi:hypothetical protein
MSPTPSASRRRGSSDRSIDPPSLASPFRRSTDSYSAPSHPEHRRAVVHNRRIQTGGQR